MLVSFSSIAMMSWLIEKASAYSGKMGLIGSYAGNAAINFGLCALLVCSKCFLEVFSSLLSIFGPS